MEMVTVVALMAIMTTMAVSSLSPLRERTSLGHGAELVEQTLLNAHKRAMATGRCMRVELLDAGGAVVASGASALRLRRWSHAGCDGAADFDQAEHFALPLGVLAAAVAPPSDFDFLPNGRPRLMTGETQLRVAVAYLGRQLWVDVTPAGAICLKEDASGACP